MKKLLSAAPHSATPSPSVYSSHRVLSSPRVHFCTLIFLFGLIGMLPGTFATNWMVPEIHAQTVPVGAGSYRSTLPSNVAPPQLANGQAAVPKVSAGFSQKVQTNDFWSSLIYPFFGDPHSGLLYAHPLALKAAADGMLFGYTTDPVYAAQDYLFPFSHQLTVGVAGLNAPNTTTESYGDWTVTARWESGSGSAAKEMLATFGHGLPYVYFEIAGGDALVKAQSSANVWYQQGETLGITVSGKHYGVFAPEGSVWSGSSSFQSDLNGKSYFSVALLPDNDPATLEMFRKRAYAFVTDSRVEWVYDEDTALLTTDYIYETELKEAGNGNLNETLSALYRHQWLNLDSAGLTALTGDTYVSPRGTMKLSAGNTFTTEIRFGGVLPALPDEGNYNPGQLLSFVQDVAAQGLGTGPTYENGKAMARVANVIHIADQIGAVNERDNLLAKLKNRLEEWFTVGGPQQYAYNAQWDVLTGFPSGYGADTQINDHHFHASYAIASAATIARFDPEWAAQDQWGGMVNLLIRDANGWDREDPLFPFLRSHDIYAGHSWAAGHGAFGDGNNQESSSESMNFASATLLWGEATGQQEIRDLGIFLYATEETAVHEYWFDVSNEVFPADYDKIAIGMVWGSKGVHSTWFGADPEFIHGINFLPITAASLYLGRYPEYVVQNYAEIVEERNGQPVIWKDIMWQYLSLGDPDQALSYYLADPNYEPFDGESRAHTLHWLYNIKKMGRVDFDVHADIPTYAVFSDDQNDRTYVAYNSGTEDRLVTFSDGFSMTVGPKELRSESQSPVNPDAPITIVSADRTSGKSPLTVQFQGSSSFDPNDRPFTFLWDFAGLDTSNDPNPSFTFTEIGSYTVSLTITNDLNLSASDTLLVEVLPSGTPFLGYPHPIPGTIEAEHYDLGGEGIAYRDTEPANIGLAFRPNEGVDLEGANDGGFDVYWIVHNEWIEYTFRNEEPGLFRFSPYVTTVPGFGYFHLLIDNVDVSGRKNVFGTGGWQNWTPIPIDDVYLDAGTHIMRFEFGSDSDQQGWLFSLNKIVVQKLSSEIQVYYPEGWMMTGLPVETTNNGYQDLFPSALSNSLYSYGAGYEQQETLDPGTGYWIYLNEDDQVSFEGSPITSETVDLKEGWNMISGPSVSSVIDDQGSDIVLSGTLYGFDGSYGLASSLAPGFGYWVAASADGPVTIAAGASQSTNAGQSTPGAGHTNTGAMQTTSATQTTSPEDATRRELFGLDAESGFRAITFTIDGQPKSSLWFGGTLKEEFHPLQLSLPPVPPGDGFDARFAGNRWLLPGKQETIEVLLRTGGGEQSEGLGLMIDRGGSYDITFWRGSELLESNELWAGESISVPPQTDRLTISGTLYGSDGADGPNVADLGKETPQDWALLQNYPNPFNPETIITYELPETADVRLEIYSISGTRVAEWIRTGQSAGRYQVSWNAGDLSSGIYLYRLQAANVTITKKMILLK